MDKQTFINLIKEGAIQGLKQYKIFASVTIAQAVLESGWGQFARGNNLFGIKWSEGCGYPSQNLPTKEVINGVFQNVNALFRAYSNYAASILDHAKLLTTSRYVAVVNAKDYKEACQALQNCGYATDPNYAKLLIQIIEQNNLQQYDVIVSADNYNIAYLQNEIGAGVDNIPGPITLSRCPIVRIGANSNVVRWIQAKLSISIDGIFGRQTLIAVQNFQAKNGLAADGIVGPKTWRKLLGL